MSQATEQQQAPSLLPTEKSPPTLSMHTSKVLLYGPPKIGKTTLAANLDPDRTLFLATEPGHDAQELYVVPIESWEHFRRVGAELVQGNHQFTTVVIDTVDGLVAMCQDAVMEAAGVVHPSDLEYGKGWSMVTSEFTLRTAKLATRMGLWLISHDKEVEIKQRVGSITKIVPTIAPPKVREWCEGFCDLILYAGAVVTEEGEQRVLRTRASENYSTGGRVLLPDPIPMPLEDPAGPLREALGAATEVLQARAQQRNGGGAKQTPKGQRKQSGGRSRSGGSRVGRSAEKAGAAA